MDDLWRSYQTGMLVVHVASIVILSALPAVGHFLNFQRNGHPAIVTTTTMINHD